MRRFIARIAILAALSIGFISTIGAAPAAAGNCTAIAFNQDGHGGPIWWDGQYVYHPVVGACSGVSAVRFISGLDGWSYPANTFIYDFTRAQIHFPSSGGGYCFGSPTLSACDTYYHVPVWGGGCGAPPFLVAAYARYTIRSYPGQTWGPWHNINSANEWIC